jgi:hypothetical protein
MVIQGPEGPCSLREGWVCFFRVERFALRGWPPLRGNGGFAGLRMCGYWWLVGTTLKELKKRATSWSLRALVVGKVAVSR